MNRVGIIAGILGGLIGAGVANAATALIDGATVIGSPSQEEQVAVAQGYTVTVVSGATWASMTQAQFGAYDLLIIGDPSCNNTSQVAAANSATWAPVVMGTAGGRTKAGNRVLIGTDPVYHDSGYLSSRATIIRDGITFAGKQPGTTGLYFDASCSGGSGNVLAALTALSVGSGSWTANDSPPCGGSVSLIAFESSFGPPDTLTTASLQGWGCSVHEAWPTFPTDWSALAVATDTATTPTCGIDPNTGLSACGQAYILIAGSSIVVVSGSIAVTPTDATNPAGTSHTITAHVTSGGSPIVGQLVTFTVTGQNAGAVGVCSPADCKTDANGDVTFTYTDTNGAGDDTIKASFTDATGSLQSATAQKHWIAITCDPPNCDDSNGCTDDACDSAGGSFVCVHMPNSDPCDDGNACTGGDMCVNGACKPGLLIPGCCNTDADCNDSNACTIDTCTSHVCGYTPVTGLPPESACNDMIDNDCDGLIDCLDPDCGPAICQKGTHNRQAICATQQGQMDCIAGGGTCQCPGMLQDPTTISFGRNGALDRLASHARVLIPTHVDLDHVPVSWLITNDSGVIYEASLNAGDLKADRSGVHFKYKNPDARLHGGVALALIRISHGGLSYGYRLEAYGDISRATDPHMSLQFYAGQPTAFVHSELWTRTASGWRAHSAD
jgi:hypothetical protein